MERRILQQILVKSRDPLEVSGLLYSNKLENLGCTLVVLSSISSTVKEQKRKGREGKGETGKSRRSA
jgi:hypothetical protein